MGWLLSAQAREWWCVYVVVAVVTSGIPQGPVLEPVLSVCLINDMLDSISSLIHMFADDTKAGREICSDSDRQAFQEDLNRLTSWSQTWQRTFNVSKCKVMHVGNPSQKGSYSMEENNNTPVEKDLGVWVDNKLKFVDHVGKAVAKANQILGLICKSFVNLNGPIINSYSSH